MNNGKLLRKTSRDNREVFAVFKKGGPMEGATFGEKFSWWMKNVFVPHLAFKTVMVIIVAILAVWLISDIISDDTNELDYILGGSMFADTEQMNGLSAYMKDVLGERDNKEFKVGHQMLCTRSSDSAADNTMSADDFATANSQKIEITLADDEILLYFLDKKYAESFAGMGAFLKLSEIGIESENEYYVRVDETRIFKELGISDKDGIYAAIKMKNKARSEDERILAKYERAGKVLSAIVAGR
ncbi:MAG: hypothetical protein IJO61_02295 [Oscillospiraceae bacterium]|nr:hypothetical protein [Oscillospiraceae bacterium]